MASGIVLDGPMQAAFLKQAFDEGFINARTAPEFLLDKRLTRKRREVLEMLLLYDKVLLNNVRYWVDDFDCTRLEKEGLSETLILDPMSTISDKAALSYLVPLFRPTVSWILSRAGYYNNITEAYDILGLRSTRNIRKSLVDVICETIVDVLSTEADKVDPNEYPKGEHDFTTELVFRKLMLNSDILPALIGAFGSTYRLTQEAENRRIPIVTDLVRVPRSLRIEEADLCISSDMDYQKCFRIFQLALKEELGIFPKIDSITDVLRLREDRKIVRFRQALRRFTQEIKNGDSNAAHKMKEEIRASNKELRYLGDVRRVQRWIVYFSLPLSVAEAIIGKSTVAILTAVIGGVLELRSNILERKHDWVQFLR